MPWWGWLAIGIILLIAFVGICVGVANKTDDHEDEDYLWRTSALLIIDPIKYTHPVTWAKAASEIMGREIDPPTPEQIVAWESRNESLK